jgi:hypothetical protein
MNQLEVVCILQRDSVGALQSILSFGSEVSAWYPCSHILFSAGFARVALLVHGSALSAHYQHVADRRELASLNVQWATVTNCARWTFARRQIFGQKSQENAGRSHDGPRVGFTGKLIRPQLRAESGAEHCAQLELFNADHSGLATGSSLLSSEAGRKLPRASEAPTPR